MAQSVAGLLSVNLLDFSLLDLELFKSESVLLLGTVGLAELSNVIDELVVHVGHWGGSGNASEGSECEGSHVDNINYKLMIGPY